MSAIATLRVVEAESVVAAIEVAAADAWAGREVGDFGWSGYVLLELMPYLADRGVAATGLDDGRDGGVNFVFTPLHQRYLDQLDPNARNVSEVAAFLAGSDLGFDEIEATEAARESLELLRDHIAALGGTEILAIHIG